MAGVLAQKKGFNLKPRKSGPSLVFQWLRLLTFTAWGTGSVSGRGTKIPPALGPIKKEIKPRKSELTLDLKITVPTTGREL